MWQIWITYTIYEMSEWSTQTLILSPFFLYSWLLFYWILMITLANTTWSSICQSPRSIVIFTSSQCLDLKTLNSMYSCLNLNASAFVYFNLIYVFETQETFFLLFCTVKCAFRLTHILSFCFLFLPCHHASYIWDNFPSAIHFSASFCLGQLNNFSQCICFSFFFSFLLNSEPHAC